MGTQENKAVVSRFMNEVSTGRDTDPDLIDELLSPDYVNLAMPGADLAAFKAMTAAMLSVMKDGQSTFRWWHGKIAPMLVPSKDRAPLLGRKTEIETLAGLLDDVDHAGAALVLRGDP